MREYVGSLIDVPVGETPFRSRCRLGLDHTGSLREGFRIILENVVDGSPKGGPFQI